MKLYRATNPKVNGWMTVSDDSLPENGSYAAWREATKREFIWHQLTVARFSWLWLVAFIVISSLVRVWLFPR